VRGASSSLHVFLDFVGLARKRDKIFAGRNILKNTMLEKFIQEFTSDFSNKIV